MQKSKVGNTMKAELKECECFVGGDSRETMLKILWA